MKSYIFLVVLSPFLCGTVLWCAHHFFVAKEQRLDQKSHVNMWSSYGNSHQHKIYLYVDDQPVTSDHVELEYQLIMAATHDVEDLSSQIKVAEPALRRELLRNIIERLALFSAIKRWDSFDINNPSRFTQCIEDWHKFIYDKSRAFGNPRLNQLLKERLCQNAIIEQFVHEQIYRNLSFSDEEIAQYYMSHQQDFQLPKRVLIRQIVLSSEAEAKKVQYGLTRKNFEQRAREYSISPDKENGGLVGPYAQGEMPAAFNIAFQMRVGSIYGILKSTYGFHLIMLEKKFPQQQLSIKEARAQIVARLTEEKRRKAYQQWLSEVLDNTSIRRVL